MNLAEFGKLLVGMAAAIELGFTEEMERVGALVEREAKAIIGDPSMIGADISPLRPWAPLSQVTLDDRASSGYGNMGPLERTGVMRDLIQHAADPWVARIGSYDDILLWQELGTTGTHPIPPRSVLGAAAIRKGKEAAEIIWLGSEAILRGGKSLPIRIR